MNIATFKCPYCNSKGTKPFKSWISVSAHTSGCAYNTGKYYINANVGIIDLSELSDKTNEEIKNTYPGLTNANISNINKKLVLLKTPRKDSTYKYSKEDIIKSIQTFKNITGRLPGIRDFGSNNPQYPNHDTVKERFGSWNNAIKAAGFEPNLQNGFGVNTFGLDGHLYRSQAEAYFVDNYLFEKHIYEIEPKYPESNWRYDWYLPDLDLYIELAGGLHPQRIEEKIQINRSLNRKCLVIPTQKIYNKSYIESVLI